MTSVAGKKPQDIYDAGASQAAAIEHYVSESMNKKSQISLGSRKAVDEKAQTDLEEKSDDILKELKDSKGSYLEHLQKTIEAEVKETNTHLTQVTKDLESLSTRLKRQIASIKTAHGEDVKTLTQNLSERFEGSHEHSLRDLEKTHFDATTRLRTKGSQSVTSVQQKLDQSLWETRGEERQYNSAFFKNFMKKANAIDTHFSALMQELSEDFEKHNKILQSQAEKSDSDLVKEADLQSKQIKTQEAKYEREIRDFFNHESVEHSNRLDNSLNAITHELSTMHDMTTNRLSDQTHTLSSDLLQAASDVKANLGDQCTELTAHMTTSMKEFKTRLDDRTHQSTELKEALEEEKNKIFSDLKNELTNLKETFESHLEKMVVSAVEKVSKVGLDAEEGISAANDRCLEDLKKTGQTAKKEVDDTIASFLSLISEQRQKALEEIAKAAGVKDIFPPEPASIYSPGHDANFRERIENSLSSAASMSVNITSSENAPQPKDESSLESNTASSYADFINFGDDSEKELEVEKPLEKAAEKAAEKASESAPPPPPAAPEGRTRRRRNLDQS